MIILDKPYVSDLIKDTILKNKLSVLNTNSIKEFDLSNETILISEERAAIEINSQEHPKVYTNSENAINWISNNLKHTNLPQNIELFKNKVKFRELIADMYPDFFFKEIPFRQLSTTDISNIPFPFIIKPSVGFFSLGVHKVNNIAEWKNTVKNIENELNEVKDMYPIEVMNATNFIAEELIDGDEYAIDAYFNAKGEPVIVGILKHLFSSENDVSDRVYYTSENIINENLSGFQQFIADIGKRASLTNFPMHIEVRKDKLGNIVPIEINPMRFGGWCTTADLTTLAFDLNPYQYYFNEQKPDWDKLLQGKANKNYCLIILDNSTGYKPNEINSFNFEQVLAKFKKPLELRKTDIEKYPVFGILFTETETDNFQEIESILKSDLKEFIIRK